MSVTMAWICFLGVILMVTILFVSIHAFRLDEVDKDIDECNVRQSRLQSDVNRLYDFKDANAIVVRTLKSLLKEQETEITKLSERVKALEGFIETPDKL